jgi:outer membrane receptor protein involved in Fe transport
MVPDMSLCNCAAKGLFLLLAAAPLAAQLPGSAAEVAPLGRIAGRVLDASTGQGLSDATLLVPGRGVRGTSGLDGRYTLDRVPLEVLTLEVRRIGYRPKTITAVDLTSKPVLQLDIALEPTTVQLAATVVTASAERGSVAELMDLQRRSLSVLSGVGVEQIARTPDSDAAQAVQRVSGVTLQPGGIVFVRGLGERYTVTQLNGSRLPSAEPEKRAIPLDLFPASLLESVTAAKTFTPDQPGDFSGAQVELKTREFPAVRQQSFQVGIGWAPGNTGRIAPTAYRAGGEELGLAAKHRQLPPLLASLSDFSRLQLTQADENLLISQFRNSWTPQWQRLGPNSSSSFSIGGNDPLLFGHRLGYLVSGSYSRSYDRRTGMVRALANRGTTPGSTIETDRFVGEAGNLGVTWGGLANASTLLGTSSRLYLNSAYTRSADNEARSERGTFENEGIAAKIDRMQYVERAVTALQLGGEHELGRQRLQWAFTRSSVARDEPDRTEFVYVIEPQAGGSEKLLWHASSNAGAVRTFATLAEVSREARGDYEVAWNTGKLRHSIKSGVAFRSTERNADNRAFGISAPSASEEVRALSPEELFDGRFTASGSDLFNLVPLAQGGSYDTQERLSAGYLMAQLALSERLRLVAGTRLEDDRWTVAAKSTLGDPVQSQKRWRDLLPAAALNWTVNAAHTLRLSLSRTLARPEYREAIPIKSRDVLNGDDLEGNPALERTAIANADLRWEWYPASGEAMSVALFFKEFERPIERVYRAAGASSRFIGFVNAHSARNYGLEIEVRRNLGSLVPRLSALGLFANATLMRSAIDLGANRAAATNPRRPMVGQAPYVLNAGLAYNAARSDLAATLLFNRVGPRIDAAGDLPLPDVVRQARSVLDFSLRAPLTTRLSLKLDAKNLLDSPFVLTQGTVVRERYTTGRILQLGLVFKD